MTSQRVSASKSPGDGRPEAAVTLFSALARPLSPPPTASLPEPWIGASGLPPATLPPDGRDGGTKLRVSEARGRDQIQDLAPLWRDLLRRSETETPFMTFEWATAWLDCFGARHEPRVLVVEDDVGPCALAPLAIVERRFGPLRYRAVELIGTGSLRFLGMGLADRADFVLVRRKDESVREIVRYLVAHKQDWDVVDLRFVPEASTTFARLRHDGRDLGVDVVHERASESPYLPLKDGYASYLERRSSNFRNGMRRKIKKLQEYGDARFHFSTAPEEVAQTLTMAFEVAAKSWKAKNGTGLFCHHNVREFFATLVPRLAAVGQVEIATLAMDGKPIASEVLFRVGGKLWSYDHSFTIEHDRLSPGHLLTAHIIERAYQEKAGEYDFLRGDEGYKYRWLGGARVEQQIVLDHRGWFSKLLSLAFRAKWAAKRNRTLLRLQARAAGLANRLVNR